MRFHVPQFIEVESKIFGPFTLKQFIYLAGGAGLSALAWFFIPTRILSIIVMIPIVAFSLALTFYKINGKPFIEIAEAAFYYFFRSRLFIWKKQPRKPKKFDLPEEEEKTPRTVPHLSGSSLQEMTWNLDVNAGSSVNEEAEGESSEN